MMNKKALSSVISVIIVIGLVVAAGGIIFGIVKAFANDNLEGSTSCLDILGEMEINNDYTCYNESNEIIHLSLSRKEINLSYLLVSISSLEESRNFKLTNNGEVIENVTYNTTKIEGIQVSLPYIGEGRMYIINWTDTAPEKLQIAPAIGDKQCDVIDEILEIQNCV